VVRGVGLGRREDVGGHVGVVEDGDVERVCEGRGRRGEGVGEVEMSVEGTKGVGQHGWCGLGVCTRTGVGPRR
jgi:hypothetical protein